MTTYAKLPAASVYISTAIGALAIAVGASASPVPSLSVHTDGDYQIVYQWQTQRCDTWTIPDAPARAFTVQHGTVRLFAGFKTNWSMTGNSLDRLTPDCHSAFRGTDQADPAKFNDEAWIESTFISDTNVVTTLLSNEWNPPRTELAINSKMASECARLPTKVCSFYSINLATSTDEGKSFQYSKKGPVLASTDISELSAKHPVVGAATASNMFQVGDFTYVFMGVRKADVEQSGSCLYRAADPSRFQSWQYWTGAGYVPAGTSPGVKGPTHCKPVSVSFPSAVELRSISHYARCHCYLGVFQGARNVTATSGEVGFFYTVSVDLTAWSVPRLLLGVPRERACTHIDVYPSVLDPSTRDPNFGEIGSMPYLYFTRMNRTSCAGTANRDLLRVPLKVQVGSVLN